MPGPSGDRDDPNTIRILIATDNHVGYEERDPIRKDDSWKTFDEILRIAKERDVDMVLLGGDLFHDNKPSRKSMYQVMRSLRKHCLGMKPCPLEFLSDANEVFLGAFPHVNYEDPDINISLPVFSIHGNHDDPGGDGHYCTLDLLQVAGLVNYFGRVPEANDIHVKPVLLQKGETKLALYGLSNIRDERLFRTFRDNKVTFYRPPAEAGNFFNLLTVHQNHTPHTSTSYLPEHVLPEWMNFVLWGHEHDCKIEPIQNPETGFHVMQPGSSIATSLIPGEATKKHVAIVSITGDEFKSEPIPLKTVRPFIHRELALRNEAKFKKLALKKNNREEVMKELIKVVEEMIEEANEDWLSMQPDREQIDDDDIPLPLIRLKVEYSAPEGGAFDLENPQRFSNRFVGKVANSKDVVSFYRKKTNTKEVKANIKLSDEAKERLDSESVIKIDTLVREFLQHSSLKVLPQNQFEDVIIDYIKEGGKTNLDDFINETLAKSLNYLAKIDENVLEKDLDSAIEQYKETLQKRHAESGGAVARPTRELKPRPEDWDSDLQGHWHDTSKPDRWVKINPSATASRRGRQSTVDEDVSMEDDSMFVDEPAPPPPAKVPAKRGAAAKTGRGGAAKKAPPAKKPTTTRGRVKSGFIVSDDDDEEEEEEAGDAMSMDSFINDDEEDPAAPSKRGSRAAVKPAARPAASRRASSSRAAKAPAKTRQSTLNFSQSQRATSSRANATPKTTLTISDDEIDDDDDDDAFEPVTQPTRASRRR